jgi:hypothetical protein
MFSSDGDALIPGAARTSNQFKTIETTTKAKPTPKKKKIKLKSAATARQRAPAPGSLSSRCVSCTDPDTEKRERLETGMTRIKRGAGDLRGGGQIGRAYLDDPPREVAVGHRIGVGARASSPAKWRRRRCFGDRAARGRGRRMRSLEPYVGRGGERARERCALTYVAGAEAITRLFSTADYPCTVPEECA